MTTGNGRKNMSQVDHPKHYNSHGGIECIEVVRYMSFNLGNAVKYMWRAGLKDPIVQDLQKAQWYLNDELKHRRVSTWQRFLHWLKPARQPAVSLAQVTEPMDSPNLKQALRCIWRVSFRRWDEAYLVYAINHLHHEIERLKKDDQIYRH